MKRKKLLSLLLVGTMALGSLAFTGCGSKSDSGDETHFPGGSSPRMETVRTTMSTKIIPAHSG